MTPDQHPSRRAHDIASVRALAERYRTWGNWGPDDELGAMNYLTPDKVVKAASLIRRGAVFSLALPMDHEGPQKGAFGRVNPQHIMLLSGADIMAGIQDHLPETRVTDDAVYMPLQSSTQWDALCHVFHDGYFYNGRGPETVTSLGAQFNSITKVKDRAVGRGVLLDLARHLGRDWLEPGHAIQDDDLVECAVRQGVEVGEGDIVLVRTGQIRQCRSQGSWGDYAGGPAPGLGLDAAHFLCERRVAAVATDTWGMEAKPYETPDVLGPLHIVLLVNAGVLIGEMWDMEQLADDCADDGTYEFFVTAPPLTITGSVGSPINPQVIK